MTTQESFKRRIRARMAKTGERYGAARRALIARATESAPDGARGWAAEPQHPDALVLDKTGSDWDAWVARIDAGPGRDAGHTAIATWVREQGVDAWWAQGVTVGYERITGLRLPGQMPDGTFSVSRSRTVGLDRDTLRGLLFDDAERAALIAGFETELRSKPEVKSPRFAVTVDGVSSGVVQFATEPAGEGRVRLTVTHEKLPTSEAGEHWKDYWGEWLAALDEVTAED